jgi:tRNA(Ile)-lysidine synthase
MSLTESTSSFLEKHQIDVGTKLLVAVSGGMDSMVLLRALHSLGQPMHVCHVHHGKRAESDAEETFVADWCAARNIPISIKRLNPAEMPAGSNFQDWARQQRYAFFAEVAAQKGCGYIATAHHFNDKVETFFGHALRGSGLAGLSSLRPVQGKIIRPLLAISHEVLKNYALEHSLAWHEDESNTTDDYQRNRIRHHILPRLDEVSETWQQGIKNTFENLESERILLSGFIADWGVKNCIKLGTTLKINLKALAAQPSASALLYHLLAKTDAGFNWHALANCLNDAVGSFYLGTTHRALRDRAWLIIEPATHNPIATVIIQRDTTHILNPVGLRFLAIERDADTNPQKGVASKNETFMPADALLDFNKLTFPLALRPWQGGDKFIPLGMKGTKLVSDYLIDAKIPRSEKEKTLVLVSEGEIVWLVGHRISEAYKVGVETQKMYLARPLKVDE